MPEKPPAGVKISYRQQYRKCGKPTCPSCGAGQPGHGPYWYAAWWADGRTQSCYVGKHPPQNLDPGTQASDPPPALPRDLLRVRTLGGFTVWRGDVAIPPEVWIRRKVVASFFKQLLSVPVCRLPREVLMDSLWPGSEPATAAGNFRYTLHLLRKLLDEPGAAGSHVRVEGDLLVLSQSGVGDPAVDWLDAAAFEREARGALKGRDANACTAALQRYGGDYLPDDLYSDRIQERRDELRALQLALLLHEGELRVAQGEMERATACFKEVLSAEPVHEDAARALMRLQSGAGRRTEAMATFSKLVEALKRDLDLAPEPLTRAAYADVLAGRLSPLAGDARVASHDGLAPMQPALDVPALQAGGLLGRNAGLALLADCVRKAGAGAGTVVLLGGMAGVGKSRLLAAALHTARASGTLVLTGRAYQQEGKLPYGPLQEALRGYVAAQGHALLRAQAAYHAVLVRLVPELGRLLPDLPALAPLEPKAERHRLFAAMGGLLEDLANRLANGAPVVLVLEDLHWADVTTLQAIHYLQRTCVAGQVLLIASYREEEVEHDSPLDQLIARLRETGQATLLQLGPLANAESAQLITHLLAPHAVSDAAATLIADKARGNPLFIRELVAALRRTGALRLREDIWQIDEAGAAEVPTSIQSLFLNRIRRLDEEALRLARLCAVFGQDLQYVLLREASDMAEETLLDALEALVAVGLLVEAPAQRSGAQATYPSYTIHHPLFREALYQQIPAARRMHLHRRAAEVLERRYGERACDHAADLAWQFGQAAMDVPAAYYEMLAGDQAAAAAALPEALASYARALGHLERGEGADERSYAVPSVEVVLERLGDLRLLTGEYAEAQEAFARSRSLEPDASRRSDLWLKEAASWERRGEFDRALALLDAAESAGSASGGLPAAPRARLALSRCAIQIQRGTLEEAGATARFVVGLAQQDGDAWVLARAHQLLGNIAIVQHDLPAAEEHCRIALALWERDGANPQIQLEIARSWMGLGTVAQSRGDNAEAESNLLRALAINERIGHALGVAACWVNLGNAGFAAGDLSAARQRYQSGLALLQQIGDQHRIGHAWNNLGGVALALGDLDAAALSFERSLAVLERTGSRVLSCVCLLNLGDVALARGDLAQADELYERAQGSAVVAPAQETLANALIGRAAVARAGGRPWEAAALARRARLLARDHQVPGALGSALLELARDTLLTLHPRAATALIARARALAAEHGLSALELRAALLVAEAALVRGDTAEAADAAALVARLAEVGPRQREAAQAAALAACAAMRRGQAVAAIPDLRGALDAQRVLGVRLDASRTALFLATALERSADPSVEDEASALHTVARSQFLSLEAAGEHALAARLAGAAEALHATAAGGTPPHRTE